MVHSFLFNADKEIDDNFNLKSLLPQDIADTFNSNSTLITAVKKGLVKSIEIHTVDLASA